jgi:hypothetical protein
MTPLALHGKIVITDGVVADLITKTNNTGNH